MSGFLHEARVFRVGDGMRADMELVEIRAMSRTLILLAILGAHQEFARRNPRDVEQVNHL